MSKLVNEKISEANKDIKEVAAKIPKIRKIFNDNDNDKDLKLKKNSK